MITIEELQERLESKFDLVCFMDLADLRSQHRNIFDVFKQYHRAEYLPSDRLVFYSSHKPEQVFLDHIQHAAARIDISNFFILFVCPYELENNLIIANNHHGHDNVVMQNLICDLENTKFFESTGFADRSFLCPLPFLATQVEANNTVQPCCKYQGSCGSLEKHSLSDIFNGQAYHDIREQIIKGEAPAGCQTCVSVEKFGSISFRQLMMKKYGDMLDQSLIDAPTILDITISPSSLCNFKCRICNAGNSTSIRSEEIQFATSNEEKNKIKKTYQSYHKIHITSILSDINLAPEFLHILGGEPFMWPELPLIIDTLISTGKSKKIKLEINSNGSVYPAYFEHIIKNFESVEILLSIDAVGPRFELQRGGNWAAVLENVKKFSEHNNRDTVIIKIAPTINIQNLLYLDDIIKLADEIGTEIVWWYLDNPSYLCIDNITAAVKQKVQELYKNHPVQELKNIAYRVMASDPVSGHSFLDYIKKIDKRRNQDFFEFHQEICKLMESQI
jgi:MoaA/NifB/PqqE/SkfB family radical SAM enzyme